MTPEDQKQLHYHVQQIAHILCQNSDVEQIQTLESIEENVRQLSLEHITPQIGFFLSKKLPILKSVESKP